MLKRFFIFLMAFSLLSTHLVQAMSDEELGSDSDDFSYTPPPLKVPPSERGDDLDFQDKAFLGITFASLIAALFFVYKFKPS